MKYNKITFYLFLITGLLFVPAKLQAQSLPRIVKVPDEVLNSYAGEYGISSIRTIVTKVGDHLKIVHGPTTLIYPESQNKFFDGENYYRIEFVKADDGKVKKLRMRFLGLSGDGIVTVEYRKSDADTDYTPEKKYTVEQLKEDFRYLRSTLETQHPRLYEFTPKKELDKYLDSIYSAIRTPMSETEFRYFLLPALTKVHCAHTRVASSVNLNLHASELRSPPFKLYYENDRAYIQYNFSSDTTLIPGSEVLAINDIPVKSKIDDILERITSDGIHKAAQYTLLNSDIGIEFLPMMDLYTLKNYKLALADKDHSKREVYLDAISPVDYEKRFAAVSGPEIPELRVVEGSHTAVLTFPTFKYRNDNLISEIFRKIRQQNIDNLIIDLRGNHGGLAKYGVELLSYLMKKDFAYFNEATAASTGAPKLMSPAKNAFTGKVFCLMDGGCNSTTGHFLSLFKYHHLGPLIGELSSGTFSCNAPADSYSLLNTALILSCPSMISETAVQGFDHAKGISPDYEVKNTVADFIAGKDRVMEFTLKLIVN